MEERQANTEKAISEHTRTGLELRRELFSKFSNVETVVEEKVKQRPKRAYEPMARS